MITAETIKQAKRNIDERNAKKLGLYHVSNSFHFKSFMIGLAIGLILCGVILIHAL
jgi:hypothetical protein